MTRASRIVILAVAAVCVALAVACASRRPPILEPLQAVERRTPVVLIPGITGSRLRDPSADRVLWGNGRSVFLPRDGGYSLIVPLEQQLAGDPDRAAEPGPAEGPVGGRLVVDGPVTTLRLFGGLLRFEFYSALTRLMESNGYVGGDLDRPEEGGDFFIFAYDWRYGNVRAAARLAERLEALRRARGEPVLSVHLVCQSNAGRIARYFLKYGGASLDEAERGEARAPSTVRVGRLILVGTDNGGAIGTLGDLDRGRTYLPGLGRTFRPELTFSLPSLYEGLPLHRDDLFVDETGRILEVDLGDPAAWKQYGWSVYAPRVRDRVERPEARALLGEEPVRDRFLARSLDRARRLQQLLAEDPDGFRAPAYYMIQNAYEETEERAVLVREDGGWRTYFVGDGRVRRDGRLRSLAAAPGDGHATLQSQMALSPLETAALARDPVYVDAPHRKLVLHPVTHRWLLEFLLAAESGG